MAMPVHAFKSKTSSDVSLLVCSRKCAWHSCESLIHRIICERLIACTLRYCSILFVENGMKQNWYSFFDTCCTYSVYTYIYNEHYSPSSSLPSLPLSLPPPLFSLPSSLPSSPTPSLPPSSPSLPSLPPLLPLFLHLSTCSNIPFLEISQSKSDISTSPNFQRDLESLRSCLDALFQSKIIEARKYIPMVSQALKQPSLAHSLVPELVRRLMQVKSTITYMYMYMYVHSFMLRLHTQCTCIVHV